jgi:hypothetical protein
MFLNKSVVLSLFFALVLTACSGGDGFGIGTGDPEEPVADDVVAGADPVVSPALGTGSGTLFSAGDMVTTITGGSDLSFGGSTTITVNVVDENASSALLETPTSVNFTSGCAAQQLASLAESALSSAGTATVNYTATSCTGSDTVTATLINEEGGVVATASVTFGISNLDLGTGQDGSFVSGGLTTSTDGSSLSYGGDTVVTVNIVDSNGNALFTSSSVTVDFTSNCAQSVPPQSTISSSVITTSGVAVATYSAISCEGTETITASLSDGTSATTNITVAGQVLGALEFVSAAPTTIALSGSGSSANPEVTTVSFSLNDKTGAPMAGETINYELSTGVGGVSLSSSSSVTDAEGLTSVQLNAGGVNASVSVIASVVVSNGDGSTSTTTTTSDPIAMLGGVPDQDSFTIAADILNPRAGNFVGNQVNITVRAADRYNNEARDGTQISFVTSGGAIVGSCALSSGACTVQWTGQNPVPASGLTRILARTTGEESFVDTNSNGKYDVGETILEHLDEAFLDADFDGSRDADEFFSDFNDNETFDLKPDAVFQGTNCSVAAEAAGNCASLVEVRASHTLSMSTDGVIVTDNVGSIVDFTSQRALVVFTFSDLNGNSPAAGTTFKMGAEAATIESGEKVVLPNSPFSFTHGVVVKIEGDASTHTGYLIAETTRADGVIVNHTVELCHYGIDVGGTGGCILVAPAP